MEFSEMITSLRRRVGRPTTTEVPDDTLKEVINRAYKEIATKYPFNEVRCITSFNTTADDARYQVPTDSNMIYRVWDDTNKKKLHKRGVRFMTGLPDNLPNGKPLHYVRVRNYIQLIPTPDAEYSIKLYYKLDLTELEANDDVPVLPPSWHEGILLKARHMYYDDRGEVGKAIYALNAWKEWISDKPSEIDEEKDDMDDTGVVIPSLGHEYSRGLGVRDTRFNDNFDYES